MPESENSQPVNTRSHTLTFFTQSSSTGLSVLGCLSLALHLNNFMWIQVMKYFKNSVCLTLFILRGLHFNWWLFQAMCQTIIMPRLIGAYLEVEPKNLAEIAMKTMTLFASSYANQFSLFSKSRTIFLRLKNCATNESFMNFEWKKSNLFLKVHDSVPSFLLFGKRSNCQILRPSNHNVCFRIQHPKVFWTRNFGKIW